MGAYLGHWIVASGGHQAELLHLRVCFHGFADLPQCLDGDVLPERRGGEGTPWAVMLSFALPIALSFYANSPRGPVAIGH